MEEFCTQPTIITMKYLLSIKNKLAKSNKTFQTKETIQKGQLSLLSLDMHYPGTNRKYASFVLTLPCGRLLIPATALLA